MSSISGKVVLITGATSGIGKAAAVAFAQTGALLVLAGRRDKEGEAVVNEISSYGGEAIFVKTDVSDEEQIKNLVEKTVVTFGRLDVAFNNAGIEGDFNILTAEQTAEHYQRVFDINVKGVLLSMKYEIPALLAAGGGAIINMASVAATIGIPGAAVYVASKHAVLGLTRSAALEYAQQGIRVNVISPGTVETEMVQRHVGLPEENSQARQIFTNLHPMKRIASPEEIASAVVFLASDGASFITGANLAADGGWTVQ